MKKYFLVVIMALSLSMFAFSVNLEKSFEYFSDYVKEYESGNSFIKNDLELLSEYREYYISMISSIKSDVQGNETDKLLEMIFNENLSGDFDKDFAFAVLISYISADLHNASFSEEYLNRSATFYKTYNDYVENVKDEAVSYVSQWIGYSLGILRDKPDELFEIEKSKTVIKSRLKIPYEKNEEYFGIFMENADENLGTRIKEAVERALREIGAKTDDNTVSKAIRKAAIYAVSPVTNEIANEQSQIASEFVDILPDEFNLNILRFVFYLIAVFIFVVLLKNKKIAKYVIYAIIIVEIAFLSFSGELFKSDVEALFYGIFAFSFASFGLIITISKSLSSKTRSMKYLANWLLFAALALLMMVPVFSDIEVLKMDNIKGFGDSIFYEDLKENLIERDGIIYEIIDSDIKDPDYAKSEIFRIVEFAGIDLRSGISEFLGRDDIWKNNEDMRSEITAYFDKTVKENPPISPSFSILQTQFGSLFIIIFMIITAILVLLKVKKTDIFILYAVIAAVFCIFCFKGSHMLFVEKGTPFMEIVSIYPNLSVILLFFITLALSFYIRFKNISKEV